MDAPLTRSAIDNRYGEVPENHTERTLNSDTYETLQNRIDRPWGVGGLVWTPAAVVLIHEDDQWKAPGGRLERGETPEEGAHREIREETGLSVRIDGLAAIDRLRHTNEATNESFDFYFLMFDCTPASDSLSTSPGLADEEIEAVEFHETLPAETYRRELLFSLLSDRWDASSDSS